MKPLAYNPYKNKTEEKYAQLLELKKRSGEIVDYQYESIKLVLADRTTYLPDFFVTYPTHFEVHEVKGFWRNSARVKIKTAAAQFPHFKFIAIQLKKGNWLIESFPPHKEK
jgi:hypothetical protein